MDKLELLNIIKNGENSHEELMRPFQANGSIHFDISPIHNTSIRDLNLDIIREYFLKYNTFDLYEEEKSNVERILINADILKEIDGKAMCSVGGLLIFGKSVENVMSQNGISFAHFRGDEITDELIDKKIICGRLQDIAEQTLVALKNNMKNPSIIKELKRKEEEEYPILVLREAIINALVHRNYSILGSKIL